MTTTRRFFVINSLTGAGALTTLASLSLTHSVKAQAAGVNEADPQAVALGYKTDGSKADVKKYPNYTASQNCGGCVLYQGKAGDTSGACPIFGGKHVTSKSWCSAWAKRG
jgi:High potential iron-sulfur protein